MNEEERVSILRRDGLLIGIALMSLVAGMHFSPYFDFAFFLVSVLVAPAFFVSSQLLLLYFTSLFISLSVLLVAGVPAALFERFTGRTESDPTSMSIWFAGCTLLAVPALF